MIWQPLPMPSISGVVEDWPETAICWVPAAPADPLVLNVFPLIWVGVGSGGIPDLRRDSQTLGIAR